MTRQSFMLSSSLVAFAVASVAVLWPEVLLAGKGVAPGPPVMVWVRETGVLIFAAGLTTFLARKAEDGPALRALLLGNAALHIGLFPIELLAYATGVINKASGIVPNSLLHVALAAGSLHFARTMPRPEPTEG